MEAALGVVAILAVWLSLRVWLGYPRASDRLEALARREHAFVAAAAAALFPAGGEVSPSGDEAGVADYVDRFVARQPASVRRLIRLLLFLLEHATLLFPASGWRGLARFTRLDPARQERYLASWEHSGWYPRRVVFQSLRALLTMGYMADPAVLRALGLAPKRVEPRPVEADLLWPPVGQPRSRIRWRPQDLVPPGAAVPLAPDAPLDPRYAKRPA